MYNANIYKYGFMFDKVVEFRVPYGHPRNVLCHVIYIITIHKVMLILRGRSRPPVP